MFVLLKITIITKMFVFLLHSCIISFCRSNSISHDHTCAYNTFYVDYQVLYSRKRETHLLVHDFDKNQIHNNIIIII